MAGDIIATCTQGQGQNTRAKEEGFGILFGISLCISKAAPVASFPYWHIDLNAGSGYNDQASCPGSPLVFLDRALAAGRPFQAYFCERDPGRAQALADSLTAWGHTWPDPTEVHVLASDNTACLERVTEDIRAAEQRPEYAMGTCVCDPNGIRDGFPIDALADFLTRFRRIDFILNINASVLRRGRGVRQAYERGATRPCFKGFHDWPELAEILPRFHRQQWFVRNPPRVNTDQFLMLVGRSKLLKAHSFADFHTSDSPIGQKILTGLRHVHPEQRELPF